MFDEMQLVLTMHLLLTMQTCTYNVTCTYNAARTYHATCPYNAARTNFAACRGMKTDRKPLKLLRERRCECCSRGFLYCRVKVSKSN